MPEWKFQREKAKKAEDDKAMILSKCIALEKQIQIPTANISCELFDSTLKTESMLSEHTTEKHTGNVPCDLCDKIFNNKCKLIEHTD